MRITKLFPVIASAMITMPAAVGFMIPTGVSAGGTTLTTKLRARSLVCPGGTPTARSDHKMPLVTQENVVTHTGAFKANATGHAANTTHWPTFSESMYIAKVTSTTRNKELTMKRGSADEVPIPCLDPDDEHLTRLLPSEILSALFSPDLETTYPPDPVATGENPFDPSPIPEDDSEMKQQRKIILRGSIALAVILGLCLLGFWLWWIIWYIPLTRRRREAAQQREMGLAQMERDREQARMRAAESEMGPDGILVPRIRFNAHKGNKDPYDIESIMNMEEGEKSRSICERPDEGNTPANYENKMKEKIENETISERKDSLVPDPVVANPAMPASVEDPDAITPAPPR